MAYRVIHFICIYNIMASAVSSGLVPNSTNNYDNLTPTTTVPVSVTEDICNYDPPKPDFRKLGRRISETKCLEYIWEWKTEAEKEKIFYECLQNWIDTQENLPRINITGRLTSPVEFPHMGALGWRVKNGTWVFRCGCTLISPKYTLTAAHCSKSPSDKHLLNRVPEIVRLGGGNIINEFPNNQHPIDAKILRIIKHPKYKSPKKYFDIALVELVEIQEFTNNIKPACLWNQFSTQTLGTSATQTGWGVSETATKKVSPEWQVTVVDIIDSKLCDSLLKPYCSRLWCGIHEHQMCAGKLDGKVGACQGDSGGPLQVKINLSETQERSMHYVIGVTSFGIGGARRNLPGVYARVSSFVDWIEAIVWSENKILL